MTILSFEGPGMGASFLGLPPVVWSGLLATAVGSLVALAGVFLSDRGNAKRLAAQLLHDARQRDLDRRLEIKKEAFMRFIEEATKLGAQLGAIPAMDFSKGSPFDFNNIAVAGAQAGLIASPKTGAAISEMMTGYTSAVLHLISEASPIHELAMDAAISDGLYVKSHQQVERLLEVQGNLVETGQDAPEIIGVLASRIEFFQGQAHKYGDQRNTVNQKSSLLRIEYAKALNGVMRSLSALQIRVGVAIREDLGLEAGQAEQESARIKAMEEIDRAQAEFYEKLSRKIEVI
jgi:hypothetical protein